MEEGRARGVSLGEQAAQPQPHGHPWQASRVAAALESSSGDGPPRCVPSWPVERPVMGPPLARLESKLIKYV